MQTSTTGVWRREQFNTEEVARACYEEKRRAGLRPIFGRRPFGYYVSWWVPARDSNSKVAYVW